MKKLIAFYVIIILSLNIISALLTQEQFEKNYNLEKADILKISYKEIEIKLLKTEVYYSETYTIKTPDNEESYIPFFLPENSRIMESKLKITNLINGEILYPRENIFITNDCLNKFMLDEVNKTPVIIVCPKIQDQEIRLKIEAYLYYPEIPPSCSVEGYDYYINFPEALIGISDYFTEDARLELKVSTDPSIIMTPPKINCEALGLNKHEIGCEGSPNLNNSFMVLNVGLWGKDRDKLQQENEKNNSFWGLIEIIFTILGIILSIIIAGLIALFPEELKNFGVKLKKKFH